MHRTTYLAPSWKCWANTAHRRVGPTPPWVHVYHRPMHSRIRSRPVFLPVGIALFAFTGSFTLAPRAVPIIQQSVDQIQDNFVQDSGALRPFDWNVQMNIPCGQVVSEKGGLMNLHSVSLKAELSHPSLNTILRGCLRALGYKVAVIWSCKGISWKSW